MNRKLLYLFLAVLLRMTVAVAQQIPTAVFKQMKARTVGTAVMGGRITAIEV